MMFIYCLNAKCIMYCCLYEMASHAKCRANEDERYSRHLRPIAAHFWYIRWSRSAGKRKRTSPIYCSPPSAGKKSIRPSPSLEERVCDKNITVSWELNGNQSRRYISDRIFNFQYKPADRTVLERVLNTAPMLGNIGASPVLWTTDCFDQYLLPTSADTIVIGRPPAQNRYIAIPPL